MRNGNVIIRLQQYLTGKVIRHGNGTHDYGLHRRFNLLHVPWTPKFFKVQCWLFTTDRVWTRGAGGLMGDIPTIVDQVTEQTLLGAVEIVDLLGG